MSSEAASEIFAIGSLVDTWTSGFLQGVRNCGFSFVFGTGDFSMEPIPAAHEQKEEITDQWALRHASANSRAGLR